MDWHVLLQELGKRMKKVRKTAGLTQAQIAQQIGISRQYLNQIENGKAEHVSLNIILDYLSASKIDYGAFFADLQRYVQKKEFYGLLYKIELPKNHKIRRKVIRDIALYYSSIKSAKGKIKPLSRQVLHKAVVKFGNYRTKIEHLQSLGYKVIAQSGISTIQNPFYRAYINQLCKAIKKNFSAQKTKLPSFNKSDSSYQTVINQWIKKGAREDLLNQIKDEILKYFASVKVENKELTTKTQSSTDTTESQRHKGHKPKF